MRIALLVACGDYITKDAAVRWLAFEKSGIGSWMHFAVVHNERAAFGLSLGTYTWELNFALTLAAIVFVIPVARELARIDRAAPVALGLIMGGGLGNLASLVLSPRGVIDFIAVRVAPDSWLVLNVADVAAYAGLALMLRTAMLLVKAIRAEARSRVRVRRTIRMPVAIGDTLLDREVSLAVHRDNVQPRLRELEPAVDIPPAAPLADKASGHPGARVLEFPGRVPRSVEEMQRAMRAEHSPPAPGAP